MTRTRRLNNCCYAVGMCGQIADCFCFLCKIPSLLTLREFKVRLPEAQWVPAIPHPCGRATPAIPLFPPPFGCVVLLPPFLFAPVLVLVAPICGAIQLTEAAGWLVVERQRKTNGIRSDMRKKQGQKLGMGRNKSFPPAAMSCRIMSAASENTKGTSYS